MTHRVAIIGDGLITSGFGVVCRMVADGFVDAGWEVAWLGVMDHMRDRRETLPYYWYEPVCRHDMLGFSKHIEFLIAAKPDVIFFKSDPGTMRSRLKSLSMTGLDKKPLIGYFPIEGLPVNPIYAEGASILSYPITYCEFGSNALYDVYGIDADWMWLGLDHAPFAPLHPVIREEIREKVGWKDKFMVTCVGTNKRSNRYPAIVEAMAILLQRGYDDIFMYLHTSPQPLGMAKGSSVPTMGGWQLDWMPEHFGAVDKYGRRHIFFPPKYQRASADIVYYGAGYELKDGKLDKLMNLETGNPAERAVVFSQLDYITRLGISDCFLDAATVHGFNLPLGEAIGCGVPTITVDDDYCRTEVYSGVSYMMEPQGACDYWHTGARLKLVSPEQIADAIIAIYEDSEYAYRLSENGLSWYGGQKWEGPVDKIVKAAKELV